VGEEHPPYQADSHHEAKRLTIIDASVGWTQSAWRGASGSRNGFNSSTGGRGKAGNRGGGILMVVRMRETATTRPDADTERHTLTLPPFGGQQTLAGTFMVATAHGSASATITVPTPEDAASLEARWAELLSDPNGIALLDQMAEEALAEYDAGDTQDLDELL
jgi:hypothetical protein